MFRESARPKWHFVFKGVGKRGPAYSKGWKREGRGRTRWNWDPKSDFLRISCGELYNTTLRAKGNSGMPASSLFSLLTTFIAIPSRRVLILSIFRTNWKWKQEICFFTLRWKRGSSSFRPLGRLLLLQTPLLAVTASFPLNMAM